MRNVSKNQSLRDWLLFGSFLRISDLLKENQESVAHRPAIYQS